MTHNPERETMDVTEEMIDTAINAYWGGDFTGRERLTTAIRALAPLIIEKARAEAIEDCALRLEAKTNNFASRCEDRGFQDSETGEIPCIREQHGDTCECALQMDIGYANAAAIRSLANLTTEKEEDRG